MGKGLDTGTTFFKGLLSKITDPEQRTAAEKLLANPDFVTGLGNGVEGQAEIDRQLSTLRTQKEELETRQTELDQREGGLTEWHGRLTTWHAANKAALEEAKKVKIPDPDPTKKTDALPANVVTTDQFKEQMVSERASFLGFERDRQGITRSHFERFKEIVDLEPLLLHPKIAEIGLTGVYELVHKDRLQKHATDAEKAREDAIRADERTKVAAEQASMPYPMPTGTGSGSPLDALTGTGVKDSVADAATAHYTRLLQERAAGASTR